MKFKITFFFIFVILISGCGSAVMTGEDYGDLMSSPSALTLTEGEHAQGWGRSNCYICHNEFNIHIGTSESGFDMEAVREIVEADGISSCATCHGTNGVE